MNIKVFLFFCYCFLVFDVLSRCVCLLLALLAVLCVIPRGCMVFPLKVHGFRAVIEQRYHIPIPTWLGVVSCH